MFSNVLVPLDGSALSEEVLPVVGRMLEGTGATVTLFTVGQAPKGTPRRQKGLRRPVPLSSMAGAVVRGVIPAEPPAYLESRDQAVERCEHELLEYLEGAAGLLAAAGAGVHVAVRFGEAPEEIVKFARVGAFDAIVMATHGRSGLSGALHGSVTAAVIRSGVAPVLVVRPRQRRRRTRAGGRNPKVAAS